MEGAFKAKVTLTNEDTKEFQFFKVAIKATTPDVFGKATIEATVRSSASHAFSIDNSLAADVTLKCSSNNPDLRVPPTLLLPARSTRTLDVTYAPPPPNIITSFLFCLTRSTGTVRCWRVRAAQRWRLHALSSVQPPQP